MILKKYIVTSLSFLLWSCFVKNNDESIYFAINDDTSIILETNNIDNFENKVSKTSFKNIIKKTFYVEQIDIFKKLNAKSDSKNNQNRLLSLLNISGANSYTWLNVFYCDKKIDDTLINMRYTYQNIDIYSIDYNNETYYLSYKKNIAIFSKNKILVEDCIRQLSSKENLYLREKGLKEIIDLSLKNKDFFALVNTKTLDRLLNIELTSKYNFNKLSDWISLDFSIKENDIIFSGYVNGSIEDNKYINVLNNQTSKSPTIDSYMPSNTSYFVHKSISDFKKYKDDYDYFLESNNEKGYSPNVDKNKKEYIEAGDIDVFFYDELIFLQQNIKKNSNQKLGGKSLIFKIKNKQKLLDFLSPYNTDYNDNYKNYEIKKINDILNFKETFGNIAKDIKSPYYLIYEDIVIFSNEYISIKEILSDNIDRKNLGHDIYYNNFKKNFRSNNLFLFISNLLYVDSFQNIISNKIKKQLNENKKDFSKIKYIGLEIISNKNNSLLNGVIHYDIKEELTISSNSLWSLEVNNKVRNAQCFLKNHKNKTLEYFFQDDKNNINLISSKGRLIWSKNLEEEILGTPKQIDIYKNGKLQTVFTTKSKIYLIDIYGRNVEGFPINLKNKATLPLGVFDYDNNKNYRFCSVSDNKIFMYDSQGKIVKGFNFESDSKIISEIEHVKTKSKDYLFFNQKDGKLRILDRKGNDKITYDKNYVLSQEKVFFIDGKSNYFVGLNDTGNRVHFYLDGTYKIFKNKNFSNVKFFKSSKNYEVILYENNINFTSDNNFYIHKIKDKNVDLMGVVSYKNDNYVYFTDYERGRVYMLNKEGEILTGFPIFGNTDIAVGDIHKKGSFNIITCNNNFIYCYEL